MLGRQVVDRLLAGQTLALDDLHVGRTADGAHAAGRPEEVKMATVASSVRAAGGQRDLAGARLLRVAAEGDDGGPAFGARLGGGRGGVEDVEVLGAVELVQNAHGIVARQVGLVGHAQQMIAQRDGLGGQRIASTAPTASAATAAAAFRRQTLRRNERRPADERRDGLGLAAAAAGRVRAGEGDVVGAVDGLLAAEADVEEVKVFHSGSGEQKAPSDLMEFAADPAEVVARPVDGGRAVGDAGPAVRRPDESRTAADAGRNADGG